MNKRYFAFTLTETLIMLAVVGILATITAVSLQGLRPDKDALLIKSAYTEIAKTVNVLANDEYLYPFATMAYVEPKTDYPVDVKFLLNKDELMLTKTAHLASQSNVGVGCTSTKPSSGTYTTYTKCSGSTVMYCTCDDGSTPKAYATQLDSDCFNNDYEAGICCGTSSSCSLTTLSKTLTTTTTLTISPTLINDTIEDIDLVVADSTATYNQGSVVNGERSFSEGSYDDVQGGGSSGLSTADVTARGLVFCDRTVRNGATGYTSANKFAYNFSKMMVKSPTCSSNYCNYKTKNGIDWYVEDSFTDTGGYAIVYFNVTGEEESAKDSKNGSDTYAVKVDPSGAISLYENNSTSLAKAQKVLTTTEVRKGKIK